MASTLILVNGLPASGKTTLATKIAERLKLPLFSKDNVKENLFEVLESNDLDDAEKLGDAATRVIWHAADMVLKSGYSIVLESNFQHATAEPVVKDLIARFNCGVIQVRCVVPKDVLIKRYIERANSGERHEGHQDLVDEKELKKRYDKMDDSWMELPGHKLLIDNTNFSEADTENLIHQVQESLA